MVSEKYKRWYAKHGEEYYRNRDKWYREKRDFEIKRILNSYNIMESNNNLRFGGKRDKILERDDYKCSVCGMTLKEHLIIFKEDLHIHHLDGNGSGSDNPNNEDGNLITVCARCHVSMDVELRKVKKFEDTMVRK